MQGRISVHLQAVALTSRGYYRAPIEKGQSLPQMVAILRLLQTLRDNFLQDFRSNEKSVINEVCLELGDERQPDNLKAGLSKTRKIEDWNKFWNFIEITKFL